MFQIGRFDPRTEEKTNAKKKRRKQPKGFEQGTKKKRKEQDDDETKQEEITTSLRVIAPETTGALSKERNLNTKVNEEAFDDLDLGGEADDLFREDPDDENIDADVDADDDNDEMEVGKEVSQKQQQRVVRKEDFDLTDELQRAKYMSSLPLLDAAKRWKLADFLIQNLQADGYENFFPIQSLVLSDVLSRASGSSSGWQRDVCVAAPTGSGKTLAFVLPILQTLSSRKVRRLRALCVLPSRDLANQVYQVFEHYAKGSDLTIGLAIGQSNFQKEQEALIIGSGVDVRSSYTKLAAFKSHLYPGDLHLAMEEAMEEEFSSLSSSRNKEKPRSVSAVDVLVCTPGRLVDHLDNTPGFSLEHLRYLIIDEADRLLSQSYHGWIGRVLDQTQQTSNKASIANPRRTSSTLQLRKWLYSATLTRDPQKLASLQLVHPKQFSMQAANATNRSLYSMPPQLEEYSMICRAEQKPLVLVTLLIEFLKQQTKGTYRKEMVVVFTSSLESTHRLTRLLQLLWPTVFEHCVTNMNDRTDSTSSMSPVAECSSSLSQKQKAKLVQDCNDPTNKWPRILVCSDGMSRGMDLEYVTLVINYDIPGFAKTYVHRCGRTARAGKSGKAISILKGKGQMGGFGKLRNLIGNPERVQKYQCDTKLITNDILSSYKQSIRDLSQVLEAEGRGDLNPTQPLKED